MSQTKLANIFQDPFYYGILRQSQEEVDLRELYDFQPMISEEEFFAVQSIKKKREKVKVLHDYPFRGFVLCNTCKNHRIIAPAKGRLKAYLYARCDTVGCPERGKSIRVKEIIEAIHKVLSEGLHIEKINPQDFKDKLQKSINLEEYSTQTTIKRLTA